jgi:DNA-binding PadR family transcriptional regulator
MDEQLARDDDVAAALPLHPRDFLILMALVEEAQHGYGLVKAIESESGGEVLMDPANLYRSLRRLERDGLVEERPSPVDEDVERRRYYGLTRFGRSVVGAEAARVSRVVRVARAKNLIPPSGEALP